MTGDPIRYRKFDEDDAGSDLDLVGAMVPHEDGEWVRYDDHAAALAERDAEVAGLRALVKRVPGALNAAFSAGTEECERGSARRQAREMEKVDALREDVRVALSASPAPAQGVTITDEMVERAAIAWCSVAGVPFEMTMRSVTLESARAALAAALVGRDDGWQSVETAPHDEDVLLYCPECGFASPAHVEVGPYSTGWRRDGYSTMSYHARATHWRPLPEPPLTPAPQEDK